MRCALLRISHIVVAYAAVLAIPTFAIFTLLTGGGATTIELPVNDDPIRNGFRVTSAREPAGMAQAVANHGDASEEGVQTAWIFTSKANPSPWQGGGTATTTTLAGPTVVPWGLSATFTATVTGANQNSPPALTVTFYDGTSSLGTAKLTVPKSGQSSMATFSTSSLSLGSHSITAKYNGDFNDQPSTSKALIVTIIH